MMKKSNKDTTKLKFQYINFNGEEGYETSKLLNKNDRGLHKLRADLEKGHDIALCEACEKNVRIAIRPKRQPHFYHAVKDNECKFHEFLHSKKGAIYQGESKGHKNAKLFIARMYEKMGYNVLVEKTIRSTKLGKKEWRKPDIFVIELNLAIEVQKAWIGIKDITAREAFFKENNYSLLWVFLDEKRISQSSTKDIRYGSNSLEQIFLFNIKKAKLREKLHFSVIYTNTFGLTAKAEIKAKDIIIPPSSLAYVRIQNAKYMLSHEIEIMLPHLKNKDKITALQIAEKIKGNQFKGLTKKDRIHLSTLFESQKIQLINLSKGEKEAQISNYNKKCKILFKENQKEEAKKQQAKAYVEHQKRERIQQAQAQAYVHAVQQKQEEIRQSQAYAEQQKQEAIRKAKAKELKRRESRTPMNKNQFNGALSQFCHKLYNLKTIHVADYTPYMLNAAFSELLERYDKRCGDNRASAFLENKEQRQEAVKYMQKYAKNCGFTVLTL